MLVTFSSDLPQPLAVVVFTLFLLWVGLLVLSIVSLSLSFVISIEILEVRDLLNVARSRREM